MCTFVLELSVPLKGQSRLFLWSIHVLVVLSSKFCPVSEFQMKLTFVEYAPMAGKQEGLSDIRVTAHCVDVPCSVTSVTRTPPIVAGGVNYRRTRTYYGEAAC